MESTHRAVMAFLSALVVWPSRRVWPCVAAGILTLVPVFVIYEAEVITTGLLQEGPPGFTAIHLLCSALILLSAGWFVLAAVRWHEPGAEGAAGDPLRLGHFEQGVVGFCLLISSVFVTIFLFNPPTFSALSLEDGVVEWASALLLFAASAAFATTFFRLKQAPRYRRLLRLLAAGFALLFFLIGMEEISWMQRVIGFATPAGFEANSQGEANLHNFVTEPLEIIYYFSAFVFAVGLPFLRWLGVFSLDNPVVALMVPRPFMIYLGAFICVYTFDMWNIFPIQWACYFTGLALVLMLQTASAKALTAVVLGVAAVTQAVFLSFPDHYARQWEITEYKEFFMPLAFLAYSLDIMHRAKAPVAIRHRRQGFVHTRSQPHFHSSK